MPTNKRQLRRSQPGRRGQIAGPCGIKPGDAPTPPCKAGFSGLSHDAAAGTVARHNGPVERAGWRVATGRARFIRVLGDGRSAASAPTGTLAPVPLAEDGEATPEGGAAVGGASPAQGVGAKRSAEGEARRR
ncbi:hypothetical protein [Salmonella enterica]|uniref:hypothetical protein n=1 Tax=Salmonella enterica TaxID=28901 RepID=UPI003531D491